MKRLHWTRANWILAGILLLQVGLAAWLLVDNYKPMQGCRPGRRRSRWWPTSQPEDVTSVRVERCERVGAAGKGR